MMEKLMNIQMMKMAVLGMAIGGLAACGEATDNAPSGPATGDGVVKKNTGAEGKGDAWNWRNNPVHFRAELDYNYDNLPLEGYSEVNAWAASYWPYYEDGINYRWQGNDILSPAEKYDKAFNEWSYDDEFMGLKPYNPSTCEWDEAYYEALGPAAEWTHRNKGNWISANGVDDDEDGIADADECGWGDEEKDRDGVETWWGICHAWAPAAIMEDEPVEPVEYNGVTFEVSDLKALLMQQYDRTSAYMLGGRCNEEEIERDENGRIVTEECRDLNAGTFHVILSNFLGVNSRPLVIERTTGYEVWNQPLIGFKVTEEREITVEEANQLLGVDATEEGSGEFVHGVEEGSAEGLAILELANNATFEELDVDARLDRRAAQNIVDNRPFGTLAELDEASYVASTAFASMLEYARNTGYYQPPVVEYVYNPNAERFIEVRATTDWLTESHPSTQPRADETDIYTRHDHYHYILELDGEGNILGGEWVGGSHGTHPDFIWLPVRARYGNPHIDIDEIRELIRQSRAELEEDDDSEAQTITVSSEELIAIPDNDPNGVTSVLEVAEEGSVQEVRINLDIEHTYRGDVIVELRHGGVAMNVYDGSTVESPWEDDITISGDAIEGFLGSEVQGEWELFIYDRWGWDTGSLTGWTLEIDVE